MTGHPLFAAVYDRMSRSLEDHVLAGRRNRLLAELTGVVLDVGAGTGVNLPYFRRAERVVATEPDPHMRKRLLPRRTSCPAPVDVLDSPAERLPLPDQSVHAVVFTLVLCTVADPARALAEAARVLVPGGSLVVLEHVRGDGSLAWWQDRLAPLWRRMGAGCHPNRDTEAAVRDAGFVIGHRQAFTELPPFVPVRTMIELVAQPPG
ncbi:class I SAM-dependent methyltransferase [Crossiella sp. NPDC003009]